MERSGMRHLCGVLGGAGCQATSSLQAVCTWAGRGLRESRGGASQSRCARAASELAVWRESSIGKMALVWRRPGGAWRLSLQPSPPHSSARHHAAQSFSCDS